MITTGNFFVNTLAKFKGCKTPKRKPNFVSNSGSKYYYGKDGKGEYVIRESDHWSYHNSFTKKNHGFVYSIASCFWSLKSNAKYTYQTVNSGKCYLSEFKRI